MIDLNCDMGEGFGRWEPGMDSAVMPLITSANIACGFHAGDPMVMRATVALAHQHGVAVGAHPGYPDLQGFGRRAMSVPPDEVFAMTLFQLGALDAFARSAGTAMIHVKPHGALYNHAARDLPTARAIARAIAAFDPTLIMVGLAGSALIDAGVEYGLQVAREAFADRVYEPDGSLQHRSIAGAVRTDPTAVMDQALMIARDRRAVAGDGTSIAVDADTLCLHGDTHDAATLAQAIRRRLHEAGVDVAPLRAVLARRAS